MEHRWSVRKPYECCVAVSALQIGSGSGVMRNVGLGGTFVDTGGLLLPVNAPVHLGFVLVDDDARENPFRLDGMVVRRAGTGVGIMFLETAADLLAWLHRTLYPQMSATSNVAVLTGRAGIGRRSHIRPVATG